MAREQEGNVNPVNNSVELVQNDKGWYLCEESELWLIGSLEHDNVLLVNEIFLVKGEGKTAGIALRKEEVDGGTIEPGRWYQPYDVDICHKLYQESSIYEGKRIIDLPGKTKWMEMRDIEAFGSMSRRGHTNEELFERVKGTAEAIKNNSQWEWDWESWY